MQHSRNHHKKCPGFNIIQPLPWPSSPPAVSPLDLVGVTSHQLYLIARFTYKYTRVHKRATTRATHTRTHTHTQRKKEMHACTRRPTGCLFLFVLKVSYSGARSLSRLLILRDKFRERTFEYDPIPRAADETLALKRTRGFFPPVFPSCDALSRLSFFYFTIPHGKNIFLRYMSKCIKYIFS